MNFLYGGDWPFIRQTGTGEFYHTDALGSTFVLSNASGTTATTYSYEAFGNTTSTGTSSSPFQFTGRENDRTGFYYYRARYDSPAFHRLISEDPVRLSGELNLYAYVGNNPLSRVDPLGEFWWWVTPDTMMDVGAVGYDLYRLATDGRKNLGVNSLALGADLAGALTPGLTGLGLGVRAAKGGEGGANLLKKTLATRQQVGEAGVEIAGPNTTPFRDAERFANNYGGKPADWVKKSSADYTAPDGTRFQTHWVENTVTGERVEFKTKFLP